LGKLVEKKKTKKPTLTIIDEVTVSTMMHELSNVFVGGEAARGGGDDSSG